MAFVFDGATELHVPDSVSLRTPSTAITLAFWVYRDAADALDAARLVGKFGDANPVFWSYNIVKFFNTGRYVFEVHDNSSMFPPTDQHAADAWFFVVGRWSSGNPIRLQVFNAAGSQTSSISTDNFTGTISNYTTNPLNIGGSFGNFLTGMMAGIYLHNAALSDTQVADLLSATHPVSPSGSIPVSPSGDYWPLEIDFRALYNGNNGGHVITGTAEWSITAGQLAGAAPSPTASFTGLNGAIIEASFDAIAPAAAASISGGGAVEGQLTAIAPAATAAMVVNSDSELNAALTALAPSPVVALTAGRPALFHPSVRPRPRQVLRERKFPTVWTDRR